MDNDQWSIATNQYLRHECCYTQTYICLPKWPHGWLIAFSVLLIVYYWLMRIAPRNSQLPRVMCCAFACACCVLGVCMCMYRCSHAEFALHARWAGFAFVILCLCVMHAAFVVCVVGVYQRVESVKIKYRKHGRHPREATRDC